MFDIHWLRIFPSNAEIQKDRLVAVVPEHLGFHSVNLCRIVYVTESEGPTISYRFAYGTLPQHAAMGEERFSVVWDKRTDSVCYEILAFSKPNSVLARIGYPLTRMMQRRFSEASLKAMARAIENPVSKKFL